MPGRRITYKGAAPFAGALVQVLNEEGVEVEWTSPPEARDVLGALEAVVVSLVATGAYDAIKAGVNRFRRRFPESSVVIEDDEDDDD